MPPTSDGSPGSPTRQLLKRLIGVALPLGTLLAMLLAIGTVIMLFRLTSSLSPPREPRVVPARAAALAPTLRPPEPVVAPEVAVAQPPAVAASQPNPAAAPVAAPTPAPAAQLTGVNSDQAKNQAIGRALAALGNDPELLRRLANPRP